MSFVSREKAVKPLQIWVTCSTAVWITEVFIKDCPAPPQLHNGYSAEISASDGRLKYVEYFCNNTYILSGDWKRVCQKNGTWSGSQPLCVRGMWLYFPVRKYIFLVTLWAWTPKLFYSLSRAKGFKTCAPEAFKIPTSFQVDFLKFSVTVIVNWKAFWILILSLLMAGKVQSTSCTLHPVREQQKETLRRRLFLFLEICHQLSTMCTPV